MLVVIPYTLHQWGKKQRNNYLRELDKCFISLAEYPKMGKYRPDIEDGYYCFLQGSHLIFYTLNEHEISIIGILHKSMDIKNYFDNPNKGSE